MEKTRYYTVEEANELIPHLNEKFGKIFKIRTTLNELDVRIVNLEEFWGNELQSNDNPEREIHGEMKTTHASMTAELISILAALEELGCLVKDLDEGLVDIYSKHNSQAIFLCWKYGEKSIEHWHALDSGYDTRKPVKLLKK